MTCDDIDEYTVGSDNSDTNASCANNDGSFVCACNDGFVGTGTQAGFHTFRSTGGTQLVFVI